MQPPHAGRVGTLFTRRCGGGPQAERGGTWEVGAEALRPDLGPGGEVTLAQGHLTSGFYSLTCPGGSTLTAICDLDWEC